MLPARPIAAYAPERRWKFVIWLTLCVCWSVGILGRGYWTPDEPREADIAWRMSWQTDKAVPLLAGEPFCEKPPLTYWVAGATMAAWGSAAWAARVPNLLYVLMTALAAGAIGRRSAGPLAGIAAAAAIGSFLLTYQVAIWLATDAPLLAASTLALLGLYSGFYAADRRERLRGYSCMHAALAAGFLCKSAAAWMVPVLTLGTLILWEKRWRELLRVELYAGLALQAVIILTWVGIVYAGPDGPDHLRVFFWNNLVGRFAHVDAPEQLQYAAAHRNTPGKYLIELPAYLWPWTLLVVAAARTAWRQRRLPSERLRAVRFAFASFLPTLAVLSVAATARNIYLAPALPGIAVLLGWWISQLSVYDRWDARALRATAMLLLFATGIFAVAALLVGADGWDSMPAHATYVAVSILGLSAAACAAMAAWKSAGQGLPLRSAAALMLAYGALLIGPASQVYRGVDAWQDLASIGRAIRSDARDRPMILFAPDETTRAFIDQFARPTVTLIQGPVTTRAIEDLRARLAEAPRSVVVAQLPGRGESAVTRRLTIALGLKSGHSQPSPPGEEPPAWAADSGLHVANRYALPNGRRYALLDVESAAASR